MRKTTTKIVIDQLKSIFARNGFPTTIVSDNGPQLVSVQFARFLKENGIQHVKASPYHPQGNGVVERMHRTLTSIVAKSIQKKGNWAEIVPMALYFMRCTPNKSAGSACFCLSTAGSPSLPYSYFTRVGSNRAWGILTWSSGCWRILKGYNH